MSDRCSYCSFQPTSRNDYCKLHVPAIQKRRPEHGDRVRSTQAAVDSGVFTETQFGIVVGFGRQRLMARVLRDGLKTPATYHYAFWETISERAE